jgi:excisionase family DNA binding protein
MEGLYVSDLDLKQMVRELVTEMLAARDADRLVTCREAARLLAMTEDALRKAHERGDVAAVRIGRRVRFRVGEILQLGRR